MVLVVPDTRVFTRFCSSKAVVDYLVHYNPELPLCMAADASPCSTGAIIPIFPNGEEKPTSCKLSTTDMNYSQIEKEALALVFGVQHFHQFLYMAGISKW